MTAKPHEERTLYGYEVRGGRLDTRFPIHDSLSRYGKTAHEMARIQQAHDGGEIVEVWEALVPIAAWEPPARLPKEIRDELLDRFPGGVGFASWDEEVSYIKDPALMSASDIRLRKATHGF